MSAGQAGSYRFGHTVAAKEQIQSIAARSAESGKLPEFVAILKKAVLLMQTDPHGWGDPEYRSKYVDGIFCHGILRPVVFRYVSARREHLARQSRITEVRSLRAGHAVQ